MKQIVVADHMIKSKITLTFKEWFKLENATVLNNLGSNTLRLKKFVFKLNELIDFSEYVLIQHLEPEAQAQV